MNTYYFTFGINHDLHGFVQKIYADTKNQAIQRMCDRYGNEWAFCYSEFEWYESVSKGFFKNIKYLFPLSCPVGW